MHLKRSFFIFYFEIRYGLLYIYIQTSQIVYGKTSHSEQMMMRMMMYLFCLIIKKLSFEEIYCIISSSLTSNRAGWYKNHQESSVAVAYLSEKQNNLKTQLVNYIKTTKVRFLKKMFRALKNFYKSQKNFQILMETQRLM